MTQEDQNQDQLKSMQTHLQQLQYGCVELLRLLEQGNDSGDNSTAGDDPLSQLRRKIMVEMVELRSMNWEVQNSVNSVKDITGREKQSVDKIQLDIQNIYYQQKHLRSEIDRCEDFRSKHENIELVPLEEFFKSNPEAQNIEDPHELMMERLRDEEQRRLDLFITRSRLTEKKEALLRENKQRKEDLESLDRNLQLFIEVRMPLSFVEFTNLFRVRNQSEKFSKNIEHSYLHEVYQFTPLPQIPPAPQKGRAACGARP